MKMRVSGGLLFVTVVINHNGQSLTLNNAILDTGSRGCVFPTETLEKIGIRWANTDEFRRLRGIGGSEIIFLKTIDQLVLENLSCDQLEVEVGAMDYGFGIEAIIGLDFLLSVGAQIDLANLEISG